MPACFLTCSISVEPAKGRHQAETLDEGSADGEPHTSNRLVDAPSIQERPQGQDSQDPEGGAVQPVLCQANTLALVDVPPHHPVGHVAPDDAPQQEANARREVEKTALEWGGKPEERVDQVADRAEDGILVES